MPNICMTMDAREHVALVRIARSCPGLNRQQGMHKVFVTVDACVLRYLLVSRLDLDRVMIVLQCERQGMKEPVVCFRGPFPDKVMWQVAVIARRDMVMAALLPRIKVILHDVAIRTRRGILA